MMERSYGIIPLRRSKQGLKVLMIQLHAGHWGFPKGHASPGESEIETMQRELFEETGLVVDRLVPDKKFKEGYFFTKDGQVVRKEVVYFVGYVKGRVHIQAEEVKDYRWVTLTEAIHLVTFPELKGVIQQLL